MSATSDIIRKEWALNDAKRDEGLTTPEEALLINAAAHITNAFPPCFIMSCVGDSCLPHVPEMVKALCAEQVPFICRIYGDRENPLYHVFHVTIQEEAGQRCNDEECAFFRTFLEK